MSSDNSNHPFGGLADRSIADLEGKYETSSSLPSPFAGLADRSLADEKYQSSESTPSLSPLPPPPPARPAGRLLMGRYQLLTRLGAGTFGTVYRAQDIMTGNFVAVKKLHAGMSPSLEKEIALMEYETKQNLPHVIQFVAGPFVVDEFVFLVTKLVDGVSLDVAMASGEWLGRGDPVALRKLLPIVNELVVGAKALNDHCIIHRDLKPSNVMLDRRTWSPVIVDLGLACVDDDCVDRQDLEALRQYRWVCRLNRQVGTRRYMAPEITTQSQTRETLNWPAVDLFALGIMFKRLADELPLERIMSVEQKQAFVTLAEAMSATNIPERPTWAQVQVRLRTWTEDVLRQNRSAE